MKVDKNTLRIAGVIIFGFGILTLQACDVIEPTSLVGKGKIIVERHNDRAQYPLILQKPTVMQGCGSTVLLWEKGNPLVKEMNFDGLSIEKIFIKRDGIQTNKERLVMQYRIKDGKTLKDEWGILDRPVAGIIFDSKKRFSGVRFAERAIYESNGSGVLVSFDRDSEITWRWKKSN